jgi:hypothetical protein
MSNAHLKILLRNDIRLWKRNPAGLELSLSIFWGALATCCVVTLVFAFSQQLRPVPLSATTQKIEEYAVWYAGGLFYYVLSLSLLMGVSPLCHPIQKLQGLSLQLDVPVSTHALFANFILTRLLLELFIPLGAICLPIAFTLSILAKSPLFIVSLPLTALCVSSICLCLTYWVTWTWLSLHRVKAFQVFGSMLNWTVLISVWGFIFYWVVVVGRIGAGTLPSESWAPWISMMETIPTQFEKGHWLGSDSSLWSPTRSILLDPLPTVSLCIFTLALVWITLERLHQPLLKAVRSGDLLAPFIEHQLKSQQKLRRHIPQLHQFQSNLFWLMFRNDWRLLRRRIPNPIALLPLMLIVYGVLLFNIFIDRPGIVVNTSTIFTLFVCLFTWFISSSFGNLEGVGDFLKSTPRGLRRLSIYKSLTILIPIWLFFCPPIIALG